MVLERISLHARQLCELQSRTAEPALHGRLQFAGEHTAGEFMGFMNGGVQSGNRAAAALVKTLALTNKCPLSTVEQVRDDGFPVALSTVLD